MVLLQEGPTSTDSTVVDDLRQFFKDVVSDQLRMIERQMPGLAARQKHSEETIRLIAHSLKGSGATYGFPAISEAAARVEGSSLDEMAEAVGALIETLHRVVDGDTRRLVLVVDDDPLITRLLETRLAAPDRRVVTASSIEQARDVFAHTTPDLILLDLFLPDGDGRTLLGELRHDERTATVPVLVVSAASGDGARVECRALGADGFITKPFDADNVATTVSQALRRHDPSGPASGGRAALTSTYRSLLARNAPIAVAAVIPETHGPGGRPAVGTDTSMTLTVQEALLTAFGPEVTVAQWAEGELAVVTEGTHGKLAHELDRARLRLRNQAHPQIDGAVVSLSAAVITDDGGRGLTDAFARARQFALDANQAGGDRVTIPQVPSPANRVLLAEDDTLTAALIIHRLEREGFEVVHHHDGSSALDSAERGGFGLVVLDVQMPGMDGFEVLERLRTMPTLDDVPIVMLTAVGGERDVVRGFALGANDYILKPFSPAELTARLKRFTRQ